MYRELLIVAAVALAGAAQAQTTSWANDPEKNACGARSGNVEIGTADGQNFGVGIYSKKTKGGQFRSISIDGKPFTLMFSRGGHEGVMAILTPDAYSALVTGSHLSAGWPAEGPVEIELGDIGGVINVLASCGAKLQERQAARAAQSMRRSQAMMAFGAALSGAGRAMQSVPTSSDPLAGTACFKNGEWVSGFYKNCAYSCMGSQVVQTIGSAELCPLSIVK